MTEIQRCYDSHLHLMATGEFQTGLRLFELTSVEALSQLKLKPEYFRGDWLTGFGWNQYLFPDQNYPTAQQLDKYFPDFPVAFTRADGHACWLNSLALKKIGHFQKTETEKPTPAGGVILRDENGFPTGIFIDLAKISVDQFIPSPSAAQKLQFLKAAIKQLNQAGFTHARDMSSSREQFEMLKELDQKGELTLYLDQNYPCENLEDLERALTEARFAKAHATAHLRVVGIKVYLDGALGSEGALLSSPYAHSENYGLMLWSKSQLKQVIQKTWENNFEISVHGIGDAATAMIAEAALETMQSGVSGKLNLEHGELLSSKTIQLLRNLQVRVHMQPCHFLSDRKWLKQKLGDLYQYVFPWESLRLAKIFHSWGSDSPIEPADLFSNQKALIESVSEGIPEYQSLWWRPHQHPDESWGAQCSTKIDDGRIISIIFDGRNLDLASHSN